MEESQVSSPALEPEESSDISEAPVEAAESLPAEQAAEAPDAEATANARRKILSETEPDEMLKENPKLKRYLDGKAGQLADAMAEKRLEKRLQEREIESLEKQERELRGTDAWKAAELRDQVEEKRRALDARDRDVASTPDEVLRSINLSVSQAHEALPEPVRRKLSGKTYPGSYQEGLAAYFQDVVAESVAHEKQRWEREEMPAREKAWRARINGGEPSPEIGGGYPSGVKVVTPADVEKMSLSEYNTNFDDNGDPRKGVVYRSGLLTNR